MKYNKEERLSIAKQVFEHELIYKEALSLYSVSMSCIAPWVRQFKKIISTVMIDFLKTELFMDMHLKGKNQLNKKLKTMFCSLTRKDLHIA